MTDTGLIGDCAVGPLLSRAGHRLARALRTLLKIVRRRSPSEPDAEPNLHLYFCPGDPAALPFGWQAFEERARSGRGDHESA